MKAGTHYYTLRLHRCGLNSIFESTCMISRRYAGSKNSQKGVFQYEKNNSAPAHCTCLQQYDEFLDFYGITEGDNMYLAPEDRVAIW